MSKAIFNPKRFNPSDSPSFNKVLHGYFTRRGVLRGTLALSGCAVLQQLGLGGCTQHNMLEIQKAGDTLLSFTPVPNSIGDAVVVPDAYRAAVLAPWGTPINGQAKPFNADGSNTSLDQANAVGQHHDGLHYFPLDGSSSDGLLCINHEFLNTWALHGKSISFDADTGLRNSPEEARKEIYAHGVSVVRVRKGSSGWQVVTDDPFNRRITGATEMELSGPVAGSAFAITKFSPNGTSTRGTLANCGNGVTPWGTYLTCEEHWPEYFSHGDFATRNETLNRYGVASGRSRYGWEDLAGSAEEADDEFARFNVTPQAGDATLDYRNEVNGYGYVVEIDPYDPQSLPQKRTALGRFRHEACVYGKLEAGKPLVIYSGHDGNFEYIYKFVSAALWDPGDSEHPSRLEVGNKYLDQGTLYVARFNEDGSGIWLPLTLTSPTPTGEVLGDFYPSMAELVVNTLGAADRLGATPMDRPEWTACDPVTGAVYVSLTNNSGRYQTNAANPRQYNSYGHILRWQEEEDLSAFRWEIFVYGAPADAGEEINRSSLDERNQFAGPDGLGFDGRGVLWIQTDNSGNRVSFDTNDQILAVVPQALSGGGDSVIHAANQTALKRFLVGPTGCEVTGLAFTPDHKTLFCNIQHPANWPYTADATHATPSGLTVTPRSATVVVEQIDGEDIGF